MKLNNKGITLVEIIVSVALISIVLMFLFSLLIQVNNENTDNEVRASYLVNQSTFISQIEEDFLDYKLVSGQNCDDTITITTDNSIETDSFTLVIPKLNDYENIKCLYFTFEEQYAYLFLYKRNDTKTILSYYRGDFRQSVELEDFDWNENSEDVSYNNDVTFKSYSIPIIGPDHKDYSINLSYIT